MAEQTIVGVDFSGARKDAHIGNTWITEAHSDGDILTIIDCKPISRRKLAMDLQGFPDGSVIALDFPFGVPRTLLPQLTAGTSTMKNVWDLISRMKPECFYSLCDKHIKKRGKVNRQFDSIFYPESLVPQDVRMRYMTYHGIRMLNELHDNCENRWHIPPLHCGRIREDRVTLLEVMPGAALNAGVFTSNTSATREITAEML